MAETLNLILMSFLYYVGLQYNNKTNLAKLIPTKDINPKRLITVPIELLKIFIDLFSSN